MKLHFDTVTPQMQRVLKRLMQIPELNHFRLVGGTALSLLLGHRLSVDLDLFTDRHTDFDNLKQVIPKHFPNALFLTRSVNGQTWSVEGIKCDFFDWKVPFSESCLEVDSIRLATIKDIAAYKLEAFSDRRSEKDFRDIAEILKQHSFAEILNTFRKRYPFMQTGVILPPLLEPSKVERDSTIEILNKESFEAASIIIQAAIKVHEKEIASKAEKEKKEKEERLLNLIKRKKERDENE
ncbi:MAG: nucleotidyl transferase AbiEii/AbiGii toxin family protein [Bacteroidota bacterium]